MIHKATDHILATFCFTLAFVLYYFTRPNSFLFQDAAEFGLVTYVAGVAHPSGTPSYVALGYLWSKFLGLAGMGHFDAITLFSIVSGALAAALNYYTIKLIAFKNNDGDEFASRVIAVLVTLAISMGATVWFWANAVEVYVFQLFCMSLLFYGLTNYHFTRARIFIIVAAVGYMLGLANHHITSVIFTPFILFFFDDHFLAPAPDLGKKKKDFRPGFLSRMSNVFRHRDFHLMAIITTTGVLLFYGWMILRAQSDVIFKFGRPDSISAAIVHLTGSAYAKNQQYDPKLFAERLPYFTKLIGYHFVAFTPLLVYGLIILLQRGLARVGLMVLFNFLFIFIFMTRADQTGDSEGYMLVPFFFLGLFLIYALIPLMKKPKWVAGVLLIVLAGNIAYGFTRSDKRNYNVSKSLTRQLSLSAPLNSVVLIADWSLVMQYYYYRIAENFRPDLVVLNYDLKFADSEFLPRMYPEFYQAIKPQYDHLIDLLLRTHPQQTTGTGLTLNTPELDNAFRDCITAIEKYSKANSRPLLTDPKAHVHYMQNKYYNPDRFMSGFFVSNTDMPPNDAFLKMDLAWLNDPILLSDPGGADKLVDFQASLDFNKNLFLARKDTAHYLQAEQQLNRMLNLMKEMKKNIPFAYRKK